MHDAPIAAGGESLEHLLTPSLASTPPPRPLFSFQALFLTAFFGGPLAAVGLAGINARRADRWRRDAWLCGLVALAWFAVLVLVGVAIAQGQFPSWLEGFGAKAQRNLRLLGRIVALGLAGLFYHRHRPLWVAQRLAGTESPNPWKVGLAAIGVATLLTLGIVTGVAVIVDA